MGAHTLPGTNSSRSYWGWRNPGNPTWFPNGQHQSLGERLGSFRFLVQAITSPCALQKAECEHCPSLGFMTPEGLRLMGKSCPARPLGPSLPTQALLGCPEQQAPALLPVVFLLWGIEKSFLMVLKGYRLVLLNITMKLPSSLLKTSPEPSLRDNCLPH